MREEIIFNKFKGMTITHKNYSGVLCGYNDEHFILAVDPSVSISFRKLKKGSIIAIPEYLSSKYKYVYEDETELIKQSNAQKFSKQNIKS